MTEPTELPTAQCAESLRDLQRYLDGELDDVDKADVLAHLDECLECYHAYDFQAELRQVIATKCCNDQLPAALVDNITKALRAEAVDQQRDG